jgi:spore cortex formation protein SpoVR/YcgB (stage V sporulation)
MTEEQKSKIRSYLHHIDGIEKTEEMIDAIEYLEKNVIDERVFIYLKWLEDKLNIADQDRYRYLQQTKTLLNKNLILKILLTVSLAVNIIFITLLIIL